MLAAEQRLRRRSEFDAAVRGSRRVTRGAVTVHLMLTPSNCRAVRAGFIVARHVGNAVVRNKVRRRLRHLVRDHLSRLPAGSDIVVRVLPAAAERTFDQLGSDLGAAVRAALANASPRMSGRT